MAKFTRGKTDMEYTDLILSQNESVLTITVNRPEVLNAQSRIMREELDDAFENARLDDSVKVVIIAGAGDHFSAGHDLGSPQEMKDREDRPYAPGTAGEYERSWQQNVANTLRWRDFPKPTIAQVHGYCIMGGIILAASCDLIVASADARFSDRTVRWGGPHVQYLALPWEIGVRKAKEYLFTGDWITAEEAETMGLVNRVVPRVDLVEETMKLAQRIALQDPFALRLSKASVNQLQDQMGYRNSIISGFHNHALGLSHRREMYEGERITSKERAAKRDERFGDRN